MLVVALCVPSYTSRLFFEGMKFSISQCKWLACVLVVMGECAVSLGDIEAEDSKSGGTCELLSERTFLLMSDLVGTYFVKDKCQKNV